MDTARIVLTAMVFCALLVASPAIDAAAQPLTSADKAALLALLNEARAGVSPRAVTMPPLAWDSRLETIAQKWADTCTDVTPPAGMLDHNDHRSRGYPVHVGENLAASSGLITPAQAIDLWMSEAKSYDVANDRCRGVCGHYKQVVNAATTAVGCARSACPRLRFSSTLVCNFAPGAGRARPYVERPGAASPGKTQ